MERLQISEKNENITFFFQSDNWADIYVVFIRPSHFLSAKLIKLSFQEFWYVLSKYGQDLKLVQGSKYLVEE